MTALYRLIIVFLFANFLTFGSTPTNINVKGKACNYNILVPTNWGVIPNDTLTKRFGKGTFDIGLYNLKNKSYFEGEFVQYLFLPTLNPLNQFSFEAITKDAKKSFDLEKSTPKKGEINLVTNNFRADKERFMFFVDGRIISNKKERLCTQTVLLTKFGFLKIFYYDAIDKKVHNKAYDDLLTKVNFPENFKYSEPVSKSNSSISNIIIAFVIGLMVYFIILYFPKIKHLFSKKQ